MTGYWVRWLQCAQVNVVLVCQTRVDGSHERMARGTEAGGDG
jgi:hypothetical protein